MADHKHNTKKRVCTYLLHSRHATIINPLTFIPRHEIKARKDKCLSLSLGLLAYAHFLCSKEREVHIHILHFYRRDVELKEQNGI